MPYRKSGKQKSRELRRRVLLPVHIRTSAGWGQACILNVSSRGLLIYASGLAPTDDRVELRQGNHAIVARVVWRKGQRLGLATDEKLPVDDIVTLGVSPELQLVAPSGAAVAPRSGNAFAASRQQSRALEFVSVVMLPCIPA